MRPSMDVRRKWGPQRRGAAARFLLPLSIVIAAIVVHLLVVDATERREHERVDARARAVAADVRARVDGYRGVLYGVRGLFGARRSVTASEFHLSQHAGAVHERYPGVKVVGYADLLTRPQIRARAREIRRDVRASGLRYPRFAIHPRPTPATGRVAPITYLEPQATNERAFGLDFLSEPRRRAALGRTLRTGRPEATAPLRLIQEPAGQRGFLVMLAVDDPHGRPTGVAYAAFRVGDLIDRIAPRRDRHAELELYDLGPATAGPASLDRAEPMYDGDRRR